MSTPASDFAEIGADLLRLVAGLARATRGRFDGEAAVVLETAGVYAEAAANGFAALATVPTITPEQRLRCSNLSSHFREALGGIASHFGPGATVQSLTGLGAFDPKNPNASRLGALLDEGGKPLVSVSNAARDALETLRRDPLILSNIGADALLKQMRDVSQGVAVQQP